MIIKKLEVQGFKSFADRTKVVFHPGITAIVGPNGTGKSNLVDALLWVLGGRRQKTVRGDRAEDIIFNGNAKRPPLSMADVVLSLGGDDGELSISHRAFRSGESEYRQDGKSVRLKDIQDELWKHSIGEAEYFVIEQGSIGTFVTSKPTEKRSLLEEAAGTAYYKDKKRQAQNKLETSGQNLTRLEDIISEVEKAKNSLQRQASAAARYRRLRERVRELVSVHFLKKFAHLETGQKDTADIYNACLEKEQEIVSRIKGEERDLAQVRKTLWDLEKALKENQEKVYAVKSQAARLESEIDKETKRIEYFETSKKKSESGREEIRQEILAIEIDAIKTKNALETMTASLAERRKEIESAAERIREAKEREAGRAKSLQTLRDGHLVKLQELTARRNNSVKTEKELELVLRQEEKLKVRIDEERAHLNASDESLARFETEIAEKKAAREERELGLSELKENLGRTQSAVAELQSKISSLKEKRDEAVYKLQALRLVENKERSALSAEDVEGSFGLLADLVRTNTEDAPLFDVFWKDEAKARVVLPEEFLKALKPGLKGNYLLLPDRVTSEVPSEVLSAPDVAGLLKSRVQPNDRLRDYLPRLSEAVIVNDTAAAIRLWLTHPRLNYITPSGDLLLASGLLKLGAKREGMIALTQEIRELGERVARIEKETTPLTGQAELMTAEKKALEADLEAGKNALFQEERALQDKLREQKFSLLEREKAQTSLDILLRELKVLEEDKVSMTESLETLRRETAALEVEEQRFNEEIESARRETADVREKDAEEERRYFELKAAGDLLNEKINGLGNESQNLLRRKEAMEAKISSMEQEIRSGESEIERLREYVKDLAVKVKDLETERLGGEKSLEEADTSLEDIREKQDTLEKKLDALRQEEESAKDARVKAEIHKAEIERDLVNLEESCWQELKKTLIELRAEMEAQPVAAEGTGAPESGEESVETEDEILAGEDEETGEVRAEGAPSENGETAAGPSAEAVKPRRAGRKLKPVAELTEEEIETELEESRDALQRFKAVNLMAEEEFVEQKKRFDFLVAQRKDLRESIDSTQEAIRKIDEESKTQFLKAIEVVNRNFNEIFGILFKGGAAEVKLLDSENPLESGVEIVAQPPGKRVQNLALLSGGEKSLTSMAFMFALFRYRPSPFCFLDEVDAALDELNLGRFLELMKNIKHETQFIIITHNYKTMEVADYIYGTTMEEPNITKLYSVKFERKEDLKALS